MILRASQICLSPLHFIQVVVVGIISYLSLTIHILKAEVRTPRMEAPRTPIVVDEKTPRRAKSYGNLAR